MPWSGSAPNKTFSRNTGVYTGATAWQQTEAAARGIRADDADTHDQDLSDGVSGSLQKNGDNKPTANIDWGGYNIENLGGLGSATEVTVASSGTTDVLGAGALFVAVSGTTTITSLGTGTKRFKIVRFTGALLLTHNATSLILPTAANITTAAGDTMIITSDASSNVRVLAYQRADGSALASTSVTMANLTDGDSWTAEVTVASDTTCDILGAASDFIAISGTTTITSFGTGTNKIRFVRATGAHLLTHHSTTLILPTGANITTAAGDTYFVISDGSSNARVFGYQRAAGTALVAATTTFAVGTVVDYAGTSAPSGWLLCYGQAVSRSTYSALFGVIAETYGAGDASTTFNLPDLRGRVVAGKDDMGGSSANRLTSPINGDTLGASGGAESHTLDTTEIPAHTHSTVSQANGSASAGGDVPSPSGSTTTGSTGGGAAHNNMQPTFILNKIIYAAA